MRSMNYSEPRARRRIERAPPANRKPVRVPMMHPIAKPASAGETLPLRARQREEMNCQIVHNSIHRRDGWTLSYLLEMNGAPAGFGSVAIGGPWKDKPTLFEF